MKHNVWEGKISTAIMTAAVSAAVFAGACSAQEVIFTGETAPMTVYQTYMEPEPGEETAQMTIDVEDMHVLGLVSAGEFADTYVAVLISNTDTDSEETGEMEWITGFVKEHEILEKIPGLSLDDLPSAIGWNDQNQVLSVENVITVQECLAELGYLEGEVDGQFGPGTTRSVQAFQSENSLPETGILDSLTYLYLQEKAVGERAMVVPYPPVYTVEDKFSNILDDVEDTSVLESYTDPRWEYHYDAFEGEGTITDGTIFGTYEDYSRPVDTIYMVVSPAMKVKREDTGLISVYPILQVESIGAYRPYVKSILLKAGNTVCEFGDAVLSGKLSGTQVEEMAEIPVTIEELEKLTENADEALQIRVKGNNRTYDMEVFFTPSGLCDYFKTEDNN